MAVDVKRLLDGDISRREFDYDYQYQSYSDSGVTTGGGGWGKYTTTSAGGRVFADLQIPGRVITSSLRYVYGVAIDSTVYEYTTSSPRALIFQLSDNVDFSKPLTAYWSSDFRNDTGNKANNLVEYAGPFKYVRTFLGLGGFNHRARLCYRFRGVR